MSNTTTRPFSATVPSEIPPIEASELLSRNEAVLVDVREPGEHARERIREATLIPLGSVTADRIAALGASRVIVHCKSGRRSADALSRCSQLAERGVELRSLRGGIEGWRGAGLPTLLDAARPKMGVLQQTQLLIGVAVLLGTALGALVNLWFLAIPAFFGVGLVLSAATGFCGLANLLARAPWNGTSRSCRT